MRRYLNYTNFLKIEENYLRISQKAKFECRVYMKEFFAASDRGNYDHCPLLALEFFDRTNFNISKIILLCFQALANLLNLHEITYTILDKRSFSITSLKEISFIGKHPSCVRDLVGYFKIHVVCLYCRYFHLHVRTQENINMCA